MDKDNDGPPKPPDLQKLVAQFGRYDLITPEAWQDWDRANAEYQEARRAYYRSLPAQKS
jgi:hypothetical protein